MNIRKAKIKDTKEIVKMGSALFRDHERYQAEVYGLVSDQKPRREMVRKNIYNKNATMFVAEEKEEVVGFVICSILKKSPILRIQQFGYIGLIYVKSKSRGQGIAKALVKETVGWFKKKGVKYVETHIDVHNAISKKLFAKAGFKDHQHIFLKKI